MMFFITLFVCGLFIIPIAYIGYIAIRDDKNKKNTRQVHQQGFQGITENTLSGTKDIHCPKCGSPNCHYTFEEKQIMVDRYKSKTNVHLLNPFKPLVETKTRVIPGQTIQVKKYQCQNCGWIFK